MANGLSSWRVGRRAVAFKVVFVFVLLLGVVVGGGAAQAAKKRVGVSLNGPHASTVHEAISGALKHHGIETTSTDLAGDSESAIAAAARDGKLAAVLVGEVKDGGKRFKLRVYGAGGDLVGEGSWAEAGGIKKLATVVERTLWARVGGSLAKARPQGEKAEKAEKPEPEAAAPEKEEGGGATDADKAPTYSRSKDEDANKGESAPARNKKKRKAAAEDEEAAGPTGSAGTALDLAVGPRFITRSLSWTPQVPALRGYTLGLAPSVGASFAWYPLAHFGAGAASNLGLAGSLEYTPGLVSQTSDNSRYPTSESDFWVGLRGRLVLGSVQPSLTLAGGQHIFVFHSQGAAVRSNLADLPDVGYTYARIGLDVRIALPSDLSLTLGGAYRYVIGAGDQNYLIMAPTYFPNAKFVAFDVAAGLGWRFIHALEVRAGFDLRRYQMSAGTNTYMVTGAADQYLGLSLGLAVLLDGYAAGEGGAGAPAARKAAPSDDDASGETPEKKKKGGDEEE